MASASSPSGDGTGGFSYQQLPSCDAEYLFGMHYVYILKSEVDKAHHYVGITIDLRRRLAEHNRGDSAHTAKYKPWRLVNYFAFISRPKAEEFERYLKTRAGRMFQLRHFGE